MSFVGWLQLAYAVEGGSCASRNTEISPSRNISGMQIAVKCRGNIALLFLCPVELIIASDTGEKKGKALHWKQNFSWDLLRLKRIFLPFLKHQ